MKKHLLAKKKKKHTFPSLAGASAGQLRDPCEIKSLIIPGYIFLTSPPASLLSVKFNGISSMPD